MNHKYVLITILVLLFGVTFSVYAEYLPVGNMDVKDRLDITDNVVITKITNTHTILTATRNQNI